MSWAGFAFWALFVAVGLLGIFAQIAARMIWKLQHEIARLESHQIASYAEYKALMRRIEYLEHICIPIATLASELPIFGQFPSSKKPKN